MASRITKQQGLYDPTDKLQSNTLKRHPKMDLNKTDLLRLLSYLEGELQARDIVIATLKAEKAKQLLYQAKYGRFGLGDPFMALQRDSDNMKDNSFDESAIKSMYDNQLAQLENLIATQRKAQLKMRDQLATAEKRYHKVCNELEDEKRKHAQDTAQGDDVTYMLEKERERLRQEIEYEKSQNKKMEKDLKKTLTSLEEERANSIKHKQVAVMLIKEQKKLIEKLVKDRQKINKYEQLLQDEKSKTTNVVEGLVQESKKSLKMEAAMEKQLSDFDTEREQLKNRLSKEEYKNKDLTSQIESLHQQIDLLHKQLMIEKTGSKDAFQSIEIKSTASPSKMDVRDSTTERVISGMSPHVPKPSKIAESSIRLVDTPDRIRVPGTEGLVQKTVRYTNTKSPDRLGGTSEGYRVESPELRIAPVGAVSGDKASNEVYRGGTRIGMQAGGKILTVNVSHPNPPSSPSNLSPRKVAQTGRGTPPPLPPNKPVLASCSSPVNIKPAPPPKASTVPSKDHSHISSQEMSSPGKAVHIPVSVVHSSGAVIGSNRTSGGTDNKSSPIRKPTQWMPGVSDDHNNSHTSAATTDAVTSSQSHDTLDFLGPEMADLQNLLTSIISDSDNTDSVEVSSLSSSSSSLAALPVSSSSSSSGVSADPLLSQIHRLAAEGNLSALQQLIIQREADVNLPLKDGSTPLLYAAKNGHFECVEFLLERGANPETSGDNKFSPLHAAALEGHQSCVKLLLEKDVNPNIGDYFNWTPLHLAASRGHTDCCRLLLDNGAKLSALSNTSCTPLHSAVQADQVSCLDFLLRYHSQLSSLTPGHVTTQELVAVEDSGGRTVWHNAVMKNTTDCLETILNICSVDVMGADRWGRSLLDVATPECNQLLFQSGGNKTLIIPVHLEIRHPNIAPKGNNSAEITSQSYIIGSTQVSAATSWNDMECSVQNLLISYFNHLDMGLKTKRTSRLDPEMISESVQYTLGLGLKSIDTLTIGSFHWKIGSQRTDTVPHTILSNSYLKQISIVIEGSIESIACDVLFPVSVLQNYLRLLEHYKSVVFYGPEGTGKSYLAHRIAHFVAKKEQHSGKTAKVRQVTLDEQFCHQDLVQLLIEEGCMVTEENDDSDSRAPILILDGLEKVNMAEMFGKLLNAVEHRGQHHSFVLEGHSLQKYFFVDSFYIIATMNKARSTGLDLSIQQRFRWVHFRIDIEPIRNFLARHFLRKFIHSCKGLLPITDTSIFRAVEWIVCVWQRLNDGLGKLGLPDVVFGPYQFLSCPLETNNDSAVHKWLSDMWNSKIAPAVRESVVKGTGKETTADGQQKVANTALYVLMQKAVVPGCPLSGQEKDKYLSTFSGSNELEIPIRAEKSKATVSNGHHHSRRSTGSTKLTPRARNRNSLDLEGQRENTPISALSIKRRSLSETSIKNSVEYEDKNMAGDSSVSAKVPKLEIRTPAIFSLSRDTRSSSPLSGYTSDTGETMGHIKPLSFSSASKRSSLSSSVDSTQSPQSRGVSRRSKSSESLLDSSPEGTDGGFGSKQKSSSPFSFSLTTPTSSLSSFKFLEVKSRSVSGSGRSGMRRSLNSLDQDYFRESESRRSLTKIPVRMSSDGETNPSLFQRFDDLDKQSSESLFANIKNLGKYATENPFLQETERKKSIDSSELSKKQSDNLFGRSLDARQTLDKVLADFSHSNESWNAAKRKSDYSPTQKSGSSRGLEESNQNQSSHMASSTNQQFVKETTVNRNYGRKRNSVESNC